MLVGSSAKVFPARQVAEGREAATVLPVGTRCIALYRWPEHKTYLTRHIFLKYPCHHCLSREDPESSAEEGSRAVSPANGEFFPVVIAERAKVKT